jgi:hypothetical protein
MTTAKTLRTRLDRLAPSKPTLPTVIALRRDETPLDAVARNKAEGAEWHQLDKLDATAWLRRYGPRVTIGRAPMTTEEWQAEFGSGLPRPEPQSVTVAPIAPAPAPAARGHMIYASDPFDLTHVTVNETTCGPYRGRH